ncbi:MAG: FAD:protein FMN transferase [Cytophagales bacterium]|nr:FAD:protein FMN transferase [Cytophagales bacterium]
MDWKETFNKGRIYPLVLILLMYGCHLWRNNAKKEQILIKEEQNQKNQNGFIAFNGETMGTYYDIRYYSQDSVNYQKAIDSVLIDFNQSLSTYIDSSEISLFNTNDTTFVKSPYFEAVLARSREIFKATDGAFDPTIMPLVNAWGFGFHERTDDLPSQEKIDSLKALVNLDYVIQQDSLFSKTKKGIMLDFSAVAKGYGVDVLTQFLESKGITSYKVEIGGETVCNGTKPSGASWIIGIEDPQSWTLGNNIYVKIKLDNKAIASSGNYRNFYEKDGKRYAHTISPQTGKPVEHELLSVSVFADDCMTADAYATAFMVLGKEKAKKILEKENNIHAYFIYNENNEIKSEYTDGVVQYLVENGK